MIAVDATAAVTSVRPGAAPTGPAALHAGTQFIGHYTCTQGVTDLSVTIEQMGHGDGEVSIDALFELSFPDDGSSDEASGSARLHGTFDPKSKRLHLSTGEWIDQPPGYTLVGLRGTLNRAGGWAGTVEGDGCSTFETKLKSDSGN